MNVTQTTVRYTWKLSSKPYQRQNSVFALNATKIGCMSVRNVAKSVAAMVVRGLLRHTSGQWTIYSPINRNLSIISFY